MTDDYRKSTSMLPQIIQPQPDLHQQLQSFANPVEALTKSEPWIQPKSVLETSLKKVPTFMSVDSNYSLAQKEYKLLMHKQSCPPNFQNIETTKQTSTSPSTRLRKIMPLISMKLYQTASIQQAITHHQASLFKLEAQTSGKLCECCGEAIEGLPIPLNCPLEDLAPLGPSVPMMFVLVKHLVMILAVMFISYLLISGFLLCKEEEYNIGLLLFPLYYGQPNQDLFQVHYVTLTLGFILYVGLKKKMNFLSVQYLRGYEDISSYSVMLQDLNPQTPYFNIQETFQGLNITNVSFTYNIKDIMDIFKKYDQLLKIQRKLENGEKYCWYWERKSRPQLQQEIEYTENQIYYMVTNFDYQNLAPVAFVSFESKLQAQIALKQLYKNRFCSFLINSCKNQEKFQVRKAVNPDELHWENFQLSLFQQYRLLSLHFFLELLLIGVICTIIFQIRLYLLNQMQTDANIESNLYQILINTLILLMELFYFWLVQRKAIKERYKTESQYKISIAVRILILFSFNSGLMIMIIFTFSDPDQWVGIKGFANQILIMFWINALIVPLCHLYPIEDIMKTIRIWYMSYKDSIYMAQIELNQIFDPPQLALQTRYAFIMKVFFISLLFFVVAPIAIPIAIAGLGLYYWLMKYKLLRINKRPEHISEQMGLWFCQMAQIGFLLYSVGVGQVYYQFGYDFDIRIINIYTIGLVLIINFPPFKRKFLDLKLKDLIDIYKNDFFRYSDLKEKINQDYVSENPIEKIKPMEEESPGAQEENWEGEILQKIHKYYSKQEERRNKLKILVKQPRRNRKRDLMQETQKDTSDIVIEEN